MNKIKLTLPDIPTNGKQTSFIAPCGSDMTECLCINNVDYAVVDSDGVSVAGISNVWSSGAMVSVILNTEEHKAYVQNPNTNTYLEACMDMGVSGIIKADSLEFNITPDMMGKRIICSWQIGRKINLPSPSEVSNGAFVEIQFETNNFNYLCEVYTPSGKIRKGSQEGNKCIQPAMTTRRYYAKGSNWDTEYVKVHTNADVEVYIDPVNGSDEELVFLNNGNTRTFKNLSQLELLGEFCSIRVRLFGDVTLDKSLLFKDTNVCIGGSNHRKLTIPADYNITLVDSNLVMFWIALYLEGVGFYITGHTHVELGGYDGFQLYPLSNADFTLFNLTAGHATSTFKNGTPVFTLSLDNHRIETSNLGEYTAKGNIILETINFNKSVTFIRFSDNGTTPETMPNNVYWYNDSNTLSRIGTSSMYVLG